MIVQNILTDLKEFVNSNVGFTTSFDVNIYSLFCFHMLDNFQLWLNITIKPTKFQKSQNQIDAHDCKFFLLSD